MARNKEEKRNDDEWMVGKKKRWMDRWIDDG